MELRYIPCLLALSTSMIAHTTPLHIHLAGGFEEMDIAINLADQISSQYEYNVKDVGLGLPLYLPALSLQAEYVVSPSLSLALTGKVVFHSFQHKTSWFTLSSTVGNYIGAQAKLKVHPASSVDLGLGVYAQKEQLTLKKALTGSPKDITNYIDLTRIRMSLGTSIALMDQTFMSLELFQDTSVNIGHNIQSPQSLKQANNLVNEISMDHTGCSVTLGYTVLHTS